MSARRSQPGARGARSRYMIDDMAERSKRRRRRDPEAEERRRRLSEWGRLGGRALVDSLTPEQLSERARAANAARWSRVRAERAASRAAALAGR